MKRWLALLMTVCLLAACLAPPIFAEEPLPESGAALTQQAPEEPGEPPQEEQAGQGEAAEGPDIPEQPPEETPAPPQEAEPAPGDAAEPWQTPAPPQEQAAEGEPEPAAEGPAAAQAHQPTEYYVDGLLGNDGNSGLAPAEAWQSLEKVNATEFGPGDKIFLKAGSIWAGQLWPKGSGNEEAPIVLGMYGEGARPIINGNGAVTEVLRLYNQEYWEISDLELTNLGAERASRRAVWVENHDFGTMDHIYLRNLYIHDVNGRISDRFYEDGGIICMVTGGAVESKFNDLLIENNSFYMVDYDGIFIRNNWKNRGSVNDGIGPWIGNTNVVVRGNNLDNLGGDGIVVCESIAPLVEYNVAKDCHIRATSTWSAGIWVINSENALFQFNEGYLTRGDLDGQPFDCDGLCRNTTYQYNYSHDNEGGFMLICNWANIFKDFNTDGVIRYNISQNDRSKLFHYSGINKGFQIYNNTIYVGEGNGTAFSREDGAIGSNVTYTNNIFYNNGTNFAYVNRNTKCTFNNNLYYGNHPSSEPKDAGKIVADPRLAAPGTGGIGLDTVGGYKLLEGSPCIDAGVSMASNGGRDYFGNALPYGGAVDIGAHEYSADSAPVEFAVGKEWNAAADYSCVSGQNQWTALMISGANSLATTWNDAQNCWMGPEEYSIISGTRMHPTGEYDAARCFTAPVAGTYRLTGTARKSNLGGGDGVVVSIRRGTAETLWSQAIAFDEAVGTSHDVSVKLDAGEKVYFIVGRGTGNDWYDETEWSPTVTLTALSTRLEVEGEDGALGGAAVAQEYRAASHKKVAGFIGKGGGNDASYTVTVPAAGEYALRLYLASGENRTIFWAVNGQPAGSLSVNGKDWNTVVEAQPVTVALQSGENTIRFYNDSAYAPSIDRFVLVER